MANSYKLYTGNNSTTIFALSGIDGWVSTAFIKVYLNDVLQTTGYSFITMSTAPSVQFTTAPGTGVTIRLQRETARVGGSLDLASFQSNIIDFNDGSVLTAGDLDKAVQGLVHVAQESNDSGSGALGLNVTQTAWTAGNKQITEVADGTAAQDAVTVNQFNLATLFGGSTMQPELWSITATGVATYTLSPAPSGLNEDLFFVTLNGVVQPPSAYTLTPTTIVFASNVTAGVAISIRNLGVARSLVSSVQTAMIVDGNVTTAKINDAAVTTAKLDANSVTTAKITDANVTYAKIQNVTTNKLLGRVTAGSGVVEEVTCTPLAQTFLTKTTEADQRTALQLQPLAIKTTVGTTDIDNASVTFAKMQGLGANKVVGAITAGAPVEIPCTSVGRDLLNSADVAAVRTYLQVNPTLEIRSYLTSSSTGYNAVEINLAAGGAYDTLYKEFVIVCNYTNSASTPTTSAGQGIYFTNIAVGAVWKVMYSTQGSNITANGAVPRIASSPTVTQILQRGSGGGSSSFPTAGEIQVLPYYESTPKVWQFTATSGQTVFSLAIGGGATVPSSMTTEEDFIVTKNGVVVPYTDYTISSGNCTLASGATAGDLIAVRTFGYVKTNVWALSGGSYLYTNVVTVQRIG